MMSVRLDITNMTTSLATTPKICCLNLAFVEGSQLQESWLKQRAALKDEELKLLL